MKLVELMEAAELNQRLWLHGSPHQLSKFRVGTTGEDIYGRGVYLTSSPIRVKTYLDPKTKKGYVHQVQIHCTNPFDFASEISQADLDKLHSVLGSDMYSRVMDYPNVKVGAEQAQLHMVLRKCFGTAKVNNIIQLLGYDCLYIHSANEDVVVVFDETNTEIKGSSEVN